MSVRKLSSCLIVCRREASTNRFGETAVTDHFGLPLAQPQSGWVAGLEALGIHVDLLVSPGATPVPTGRTRLARFMRLPKKAVYRLWDRVRNWRLAVALLRRVAAWRPDLVWLPANVPALPRWLLRRVRHRYGARILLTDGCSPAWTAGGLINQRADDVDYVFTNARQSADEYRARGITAVALPVSAVDDRIVVDDAACNAKPYYDIAFVGSLRPDFYRNRLEILQALRDFALNIWCPDPPELLENYGLRAFYRGNISRAQCGRIYSCSRITLNIHGRPMSDGGNLSTFEIPANNGFEVADACHSTWFAAGTDLILFDGISDLRAKLSYYLERPELRRSIAAAGRARALRDHTTRVRTKQLVASLAQPS